MLDAFDLVVDKLIYPASPRNGEIWSYCPAHNDGVADGRKSPPGTRGSRSLRISRKTGIKCFAGCKMIDILKAFGVYEEWAAGSGTSKAPVRNESRQQRGKLVREYWYCRADGTPVAIKGRFEFYHPDGTKSKTFNWRMVDSEGWSGISIPMDDLPLYGSEKLASRPNEPVYFVEGEKACEACWEAGLVAVCAGCGASGTPRIGRAALEVLRDRDVVLWADNDDIGKRYMNAVRSLLDDIASVIKIVNVPVPPSGDAHDFFSSGKGKDDLYEMPTEPWLAVNNDNSLTFFYPDAAGLVKITCDSVVKSRDELNAILRIDAGVARHSYRQRINLMSLSSRQSLSRELKEYFGDGHKWGPIFVDLAAELDDYMRGRAVAIDVATIERPPQRNDLVRSLLPEGEASMFFGEGDSGKTYLGLYLSFLVACGGKFLGEGQWIPQMPVLWVDYETRPDGSTVKYRLGRIAQGIGVPLQERMIFYVPGNGVPLWELFDTLKDTITKEGIGFLVIDSALKACGGSARDEGVVGAYFSALQRLNVTSLTLGHVSKSEIGGEEKPDMPFGSVFWYNEPHGYIWYVERKQREESSSRQIIELKNKKANDGRRPGDMSIELMFHDPAGAVMVSRSVATRERQVIDRKAMAAGERLEDL